MVLVITDVDWNLESNSGSFAALFLEFEQDQSLGLPVFDSRIRLAGGESYREVHDSFTTGFVVPSKTRLRPYYVAPITMSFWRITVFVRGYLVADK